jgi:hypothetical protein
MSNLGSFAEMLFEHKEDIKEGAYIKMMDELQANYKEEVSNNIAQISQITDDHYHNEIEPRMVQAVGQTLLDLVSDQRGGIDDDSDDDTEELLLPYVGKIIDYAKEIYTGN